VKRPGGRPDRGNVLARQAADGLSMRIRKLSVVVAALVAVAMAPVVEGPAGAVTPSFADVAAAPICGFGSTGFERQTSAPSARTLVTGVSPADLRVVGNALYVLDARGTVRVYDRQTGAPGVVMTIPGALQSRSFAVGPDGAVYVSLAPGDVVKMDRAGAVVWRKTFGAAAGSLVPWFGAGAAVFSLNGNGATSGTLIGSDGSAVGSTAIAPASDQPLATPDGTGGTLVTDERWVRDYSAQGSLTSIFGSPLINGDRLPGAPLNFYQQGSAVRMADGTMLVADHGSGFHVVSDQGIWMGAAPESLVPGGLSERSAMALVGDDLYVVAGVPFTSDKTVVVISATGVRNQAVRSDDPRMGFGAGLTANAQGNFFPDGTSPAVTATFTQDWAQRGLTLRYSVQNLLDVGAGVAPTTQDVTLSAAAVASGVPIALLGTTPGAYRIDARLLDTTGAQVSGTCLGYTVGSSGEKLDFGSLPPGMDNGGALPLRNVVLAGQLGTNMTRVQIDWPTLMPDPAAPLQFGDLDKQLLPALAEAQRLGVTVDVQVGQGGKERDLVDKGQWQARVAELVSHYRGKVKVWEAWNEPNATFGPAAQYVTEVLKPFYAAVKATDPSATVAGGTVVGFDLGYWGGVLDAGGGAAMDVAALHTYTGHNRSWEEQDAVTAIQTLRQMFTSHGLPSTPFWDTESAWWSDGDTNLINSANYVARRIVLGASVGMTAWAPFIPESSFGSNWGVIFSPGAVKPAALTMMTALAQVKARPFLQMVQTTVPHVFLAQFGPSPTSAQPLSVLWSDDTPLRVAVAGSSLRTAVNPYGAPQPITSSFTLTGAPIFITGPLVAGIDVVPDESFGTNLAQTSLGATAVGSSQLDGTTAAGALDGQSTTQNNNEYQGRPAWVSAPGDDARTLVVTLPRTATADRILVSTTSNGSIQAGLRDYTVEVDDGSGAWHSVGAVRGQLYNRGALLTFAPQPVARFRVRATAVNFSGYYNGARPPWWSTDPVKVANPDNGLWGPAVIDEVEIYAPGPSATSGFCGIDTAHSGDTYAQWTCQR
jgi:hypothetical protein